jgi:hypothetical protein
MNVALGSAVRVPKFQGLLHKIERDKTSTA